MVFHTEAAVLRSDLLPVTETQRTGLHPATAMLQPSEAVVLHTDLPLVTVGLRTDLPSVTAVLCSDTPLSLAEPGTDLTPVTVAPDSDLPSASAEQHTGMPLAMASHTAATAALRMGLLAVMIQMGKMSDL